MSDKDKNPEIDVFSQLEDALEEREGSDRRKKMLGMTRMGIIAAKGIVEPRHLLSVPGA